MSVGTFFHQRVVVSDNTVVMRLGKPLKFSAAHCVWTADSTVGNREISFALLDPDGNVVIDVHPAVVTTANDVHHIEYISGVTRDQTFQGPGSDRIVVGMPNNFIVAGRYSMKLYDEADVSSGDSFVLNVFGEI